MTAKCKVPAAAVDVLTEGGCGVSGPFDYEYANGACHESKAQRETQRGREQSRSRWEGGLKDRQGVVAKREVKCFHISFECALCNFIELFSGTRVNAQFVSLSQ